jgi:hypothetical protein
MEILGGRKFVEIPGDKNHELPPLLIRSKPANDLGTVMQMASEIVDSEDLIPSSTLDELASGLDLLERRRMDLAVNLVERYLAFVAQWNWGDGILDWIRQCETTFDTRCDLRSLLRPDVWPHAGRSSFVQLLEDKHVKAEGLDVEKAVGMRLTFRQPPPMSCFSNQFLLLLNSTVADTAYQTWSHMMPAPVSSLPPERFWFQVYSM